MIVDHTSIDEQIAVPQMAALEADLFGRGAWSEQSIRQEFQAPARTYLFDIDDDGKTADCGIAGCVAADEPVAGSVAGDSARQQPVVRGYAGFWYDGDDAEIKRMLLEVRVDNTPALALYERFGFAKMGLRKRYYQPEGIDAYTMSLDLEPRIVGFAAAEQ